MVAGSMAMDWAKMMGMTPPMFTFMGMWVDWPPYIFRPTTRLAYCTGMRRSELEMKTISTTRASRPMMMTGIIQGASGGCSRIYCWACSAVMPASVRSPR